MVRPTEQRDAWKAYAALPEGVHAEVVNGRLELLPAPGLAHQEALSALEAWLRERFRHGRMGGPGGWWFAREFNLSLGGANGQKLEPDLAGWRRTRLPQLPDALEVTLAPDWVCEGLSPGTEVRDRTEKMELWGKFGVGHVWLLDGAAHTLEVFRNDGGVMRPVSQHRAQARVRAEPFDACELELADLWLPDSGGANESPA